MFPTREEAKALRRAGHFYEVVDKAHSKHA